jgi:hypothetical protein
MANEELKEFIVKYSIVGGKDLHKLVIAHSEEEARQRVLETAGVRRDWVFIEAIERLWC